MNIVRRLRKEAALAVSRVAPITITKGIDKGMRLYGDLFYNRRPGELYEEEILYSALDLRDRVVIEAGAHIGLYSMYFGRNVGSGRVLAFEPGRTNFMFLSRNISTNRLQRVVPINAGLSNEVGSQKLLSKRFNTQKGTFKSDKQSLMRATHEPLIESMIPVTTIDAAVDEHRLDRVDFIKVDTEGYEPFVVEGMVRTLDRFDPFVYFEIHGLTPEQRLGDLQRVFRTLDPLGYSVRRLAPGLPAVTAERISEFTEGAFVAARVYTDPLRSALRHWGSP